MKKIILILFITCFGINLFAQNRTKPHLTPEEFRAKQEAYITQKADLNEKEVKKFFPVFFELQDKKREVNDKVTKLIKKGKEKDTSEKEYQKIVEDILELRIQSSQLEKEYYKRFQKLLPAKKVYLVQTAEMNFHRELLKGVNQNQQKKTPDNNGNRLRRNN